MNFTNGDNEEAASFSPVFNDKQVTCEHDISKLKKGTKVTRIYSHGIRTFGSAREIGFCCPYCYNDVFHNTPDGIVISRCDIEV